MTDDRGTIISESDSNSKRSGDDRDKREDEERIVGGEVTLTNTLTHSPTLSQIPSLTIIHHIYNLGIQNYSLDCDDHYNVGLYYVSIYSSLRISYLNHLMIVVVLAQLRLEIQLLLI